MNKKLFGRKGFTLVELLIVIALIGILSVAVLATINPIEQTNKARDAKFKNDTAEVLSAFERYYAAKNAYPWNDVGTTIAPSTAVAIGSTESRFGVLGASGAADGILITTSELKSSFAGKEPFTSIKAEDRMYVYYNGADSNYVCFVPKATANRSKTSELHCITALGVGATYATANVGTCTTTPDFGTSWAAPTVGNVAYFMCVPQ